MNIIQYGVEGGCSSEEKRVRPLYKDQRLGTVAIICMVHTAKMQETLVPDPTRSLQEQLDSFCKTCPENRNYEPRESEPFS